MMISQDAANAGVLVFGIVVAGGIVLLTAMMGVSLLTKLGNDALVPASSLLAANKERMMPAPTGDDGSSSSVLVVPGVIDDPDAWTKFVQRVDR